MHFKKAFLWQYGNLSQILWFMTKLSGRIVDGSFRAESLWVLFFFIGAEIKSTDTWAEPLFFFCRISNAFILEVKFPYIQSNSSDLRQVWHSWKEDCDAVCIYGTGKDEGQMELLPLQNLPSLTERGIQEKEMELNWATRIHAHTLSLNRKKLATERTKNLWVWEKGGGRGGVSKKGGDRQQELEV